MTNPVSGNATGLPSRRRAIATFAGASIAVALPAAVRADVAPQVDVDRLWADFLQTRRVLRDTSDNYGRASDQLPWWAAPGPIYLNSAGEMVGDICGWPAIQGVAVPQVGVSHLLRISRDDIERWHERDRFHFGDKAAQESRNKRLAALEERITAQRTEQARLGLPALSAAADAADDAMWAARDAIFDLPSGSLNALAAQVMIEVTIDCEPEDTANTCQIMTTTAHVLRGLLPHLDGVVARDAAEFIEDLDRPLRALRTHDGVLIGGAA